MALDGKNEFKITIGGAERTVTFDLRRTAALAGRLNGKTPLQHIREEYDPMILVTEGLFVGLSEKGSGITPEQIRTWLQEWDGDVDDVIWDILYAWTWAHPPQMAKKTAKLLDMMRKEMNMPVHEKAGAGPLVPTGATPTTPGTT